VNVEHLTAQNRTKLEALERRGLPNVAVALPPPASLKDPALHGVRDALAAFRAARAEAEEALDEALDFEPFAVIQARYTREVEAAVASDGPLPAEEPNETAHEVRHSKLLGVATTAVRKANVARDALTDAVHTARLPVRAAIYAQAVEAAATLEEAFAALQAARSRVDSSLGAVRSLDGSGLLALAGDDFGPREAAKGIIARLEAPLRERHWATFGKRYEVIGAWNLAAESIRLALATVALRAVDPVTAPGAREAIADAQASDDASAAFYEDARAAAQAGLDAQAARNGGRS
jgi:hypothetical protein